MADISIVGQTLSGYEDLKAKAEEKKAAEEKKIAENNQWGSLFGVDGDNFTDGSDISSKLAGGASALAAPITGTFNIFGGVLGGKIATTNSNDNESSGALSGLVSSVKTLFGGVFNVTGGILKGVAGAIGGAVQPQCPPPGGQAPSGTSAPSSSGTTNKTGETKTENKKEESNTISSTTTPKTSSSSSSKNTSFGSFSYKYTTDADGNLTTGVFDKAGNAVSIDTKGYEKVSSEVRTSVEEYQEAAQDYADAEKELKDLEEKIATAEKEDMDGTQKAYAEAKGNYDGAVKQVEYLQGKQDSIAADLSAMMSQRDNCSEDQIEQIEASIIALKAQRDEIKTQLEDAIKNRDACYEKMSEAESNLGDKKADSKTNKLAGLYAKRDAAEAKKKSADTLRQKAQETLKTAVARADQKYSAGEFQGEDGELAKAEQMKKDEAATSAITKALDKKEGDITSQMRKRSGEIAERDILNIEAKKLGLQVKDGASLDEIQKAITDKKTADAKKLADAKAEAKKLGLEVKDGASLDEIQKQINDKKIYNNVSNIASSLGITCDTTSTDTIITDLNESLSSIGITIQENSNPESIKSAIVDLATKNNIPLKKVTGEDKNLFDLIADIENTKIWS